MHVCPFNIHAGFSVLIHPALVQIHFSWSVSFFHLGHFLSVSHLSPLRQKICYHGFVLSVMPFRALGSTHSSVSEWNVFLAFSDAGILQLSLPFLACSLVALLLFIAVLWHQFQSISPVVAWSLSQSGPTYTVARYYQQERANISERLLFLYLMLDPPVC